MVVFSSGDAPPGLGVMPGKVIRKSICMHRLKLILRTRFLGAGNIGIFVVRFQRCSRSWLINFIEGGVRGPCFGSRISVLERMVLSRSGIGFLAGP